MAHDHGDPDDEAPDAFEEPPSPADDQDDSSPVISRLDRIEGLIRSALAGEDRPDDQGGAHTPDVTFEPEPDALPITADAAASEEDIDDGAGTGEGTANLAHERVPAFRFPHRRTVRV